MEAVSGTMPDESHIRLPRMAGSWYPGEPAALAALLDTCLGEAAPLVPLFPAATRLAGLVAPHAGYVYSGHCAGYAYASLGTWRPARVVVVAPSHREAFAGVCLWSPEPGQPAAGAWRTPLGDVEVDLELACRLREALPGLRCGSVGHGAEHSLELQLPFLQRALGSFRLLPLVMGDQGPATVESLAGALAEVLADGEPTLLVASTDLSHFHGDGTAAALDGRFLRLLESADGKSLQAGLEAGSAAAGFAGPGLKPR